ncbi:MAG: PriCT-2 domain-containing protein, partial [Candidatus Fonsibacter sp.]
TNATTRAPRIAPAAATTGAATTQELHDINALCCCLSISQVDNYVTWLRVGMILKKLGAPMSLWEEVIKRSNKYKHGDCAKRWGGFRTQYFSIGSLFVLAKGGGNAEMLERIKPTLTTKTPCAEVFPGQARLRTLSSKRAT